MHACAHARTHACTHTCTHAHKHKNIPGSTEEGWGEFTSHSKSHMREKRLGASLQTDRDPRISNICSKSQKKSFLHTLLQYTLHLLLQDLICNVIWTSVWHTHLYSIVKACVRPASHSDILAHGRWAALDWSIKPSQDGCILHLVEHTQRHNA